jgi:16S rRNA (cytosine1402-N4)-methyltransferase
VTIHIPVLIEEVLEGLNLEPGKVVIDGTLGGGGHSAEILKRVGTSGHLYGFDRDPDAVEDTSTRINADNATLIVGNYADIPEHLDAMGLDKVDGILLDLGFSSDQLLDEERGFSYQHDGPIDLRFNRMAGEPASKLINRLSERHLADLIYQFGEERLSRRIARKIVKVRNQKKIETAREFANLVRSCVPRSKNHSIDPATRTFQAFRIAVNEELKWLKVAMKRFPEYLNPGGRFAVISFHSLEDRIVKHSMNENETLEVLTKKPIMASEQELGENPRSRSAKLRVAERKCEQQ